MEIHPRKEMRSGEEKAFEVPPYREVRSWRIGPLLHPPEEIMVLKERDPLRRI